MKISSLLGWCGSLIVKYLVMSQRIIVSLNCSKDCLTQKSKH